jgi:tetratricopeptide (TPR) repeat protein/DNA-binding CsgD family transcriptional regulator
MKFIYLPPFVLGLLLMITAGKTLGQARQKIDSLSLLLNQHHANDTTRVILLNQIGFEYWTIDPLQSEKYGLEAFRLSENLAYTQGMAMAHRVVGVSYWSRGDYFKALTHLYSSQKLYKTINDLLGEANSTMNIGLVYADQKDSGRALENFQYAIQLFERLGHRDRVGITYNKIGTVYLEKADFNRAKEYLVKGIKIHQENNFAFGIMEASNRLGLLAHETGDEAEAIHQLEYSLSLARKGNDIEHTVKNLENLASVYIAKKQFDNAKTLLDEAYPLAIAHQYRKWLRDIYRDYKDLYTARQDYGRALDFTTKFEAIKDSIFSEEKAAQLANLQVEYQTAQQQQALRLREQQIMLLQQESKIDRLVNLFLIAGIGLLLVSAFLLFQYQKIRYKQKQVAIEREHEISKIELENIQLREEELKRSLEFRNKELTAYTVNFIRKNELIENIKERLDALRQAMPEHTKAFSPLYSLVQQNPGIDKDWEDFKRTFENVHQNFFSRLLERCPELTQSELRLCALICLNLSIKEMASLMGISPDSVKTARYRLRKRLNLDQEQNLTDFVIGFA